MRQVAIFNEKIKQIPSPTIQIKSEHVQSFPLYSERVTTGLIETIDTRFDGSLPKNHHAVLVRKKAFSCNYRDKSILIRAKDKLDELSRQNQIKYYTLGSEFVGEVVAIGAEVVSLKVGDRVIGNGNFPYSGYEGVRPGLPTNNGSKELEAFHFAKLVRIPDSMSDTVGASFPIGGQTAYSMIRKLKLQPGENVLVTAATSNTSLFAINALQSYPVNVYAITTRDSYTDRLKALGVKDVFVVERGNISLRNHPQILSFMQENGGFQAVIDPFFDIYLPQSVDILDFHGRYTTRGMFAQSHHLWDDAPQHDLVQVMNQVMIKNLQIIGNCIGKTDDLERAIQDYADGKLEVVVDSVFTGHEAADFFDRSFNANDRFGKVVYTY